MSLALFCATSTGLAAQGEVPRAVTVARATSVPACTHFVDAAGTDSGAGTALSPYKGIATAARNASPGAIICVAEGAYPEQIVLGAMHVTLAGGFQQGKGFRVRDSAAYISRAVGNGSGSFIRVIDEGPTGANRTVVDGFDISGYSQAIVRDHYQPQRFDITNNHIHDNHCVSTGVAGAGFALNNVSGRIVGNVFRNNTCGRGGAGYVNDDTKSNEVIIERNWIEGNAGTEPEAAHGGGLYLFATTLRLTANMFTGNRVTQWGGGLYVGADTGSGQSTTANLNWNVYRENKAGRSGGGFFCDDGARCISYHEIYDGNCGGNILLDSGPEDTGRTSARFDHMTNINARDPECKSSGYGVIINRDIKAPESYAVVNALFWGNRKDGDIAVLCDAGCDKLTVHIAHSMVQTGYEANGGAKVVFGEYILAPSDPRFVNPAKGDYHLRSAAGRWTQSGRVKDNVTSPAIAAGTPIAEGPARGRRIELGAYGNSAEESSAP